MQRCFFGFVQGAGTGPQARQRAAPPARAKPVRPLQAGGLRPGLSPCSCLLSYQPQRRHGNVIGPGLPAAQPGGLGNAPAKLGGVIPLPGRQLLLHP